MEVIGILTSVPPQDVTQTTGVPRSNVNNPTVVVVLNLINTSNGASALILALNNGCLQREMRLKPKSAELKSELF